MVSKLNKIKNQPATEIGGVFEQSAFWTLCILLFLSPFFRGLFFVQEQRIALIISCLIFGLISIIEYQRRQLRFFASPLEYLILGLPLVYLISLMTAANYALAVDEIIKNLLYFFVFWSVLRLVHSEIDIEKIIWAIYLSAIGVSLAGLFTATGLIEINGGFLTSDGGTIASTFQYKNSLASFLVAGIFIGHYLWGKQNKNLLNIAITTGNFLLLTVLFSTQSHGGYIIFAIFTGLYWLLNPASKRFSLILSLLILSSLGFIASHLFLVNIASNKLGLAWLCLIVGLALVAIVHWLTVYFKLPRKQIIISFNQILIFIVTLVLLGIVALGLLGGFQIILEKIHMFGAMERLTMYQDGLKMISVKPIFGWGGGGWSEAYTQFQGYAYSSRLAHSYFLQVAIETGLVGLMVIISIWVVFIIKAYKVYRESLHDSSRTAMNAALLCSILAIISHAIFDFDLSLSALTLMMFTLMACFLAGSKSEESITDHRRNRKITTASGYKFGAAIVIVIGIIIISLTLISSTNLTNTAIASVKTGNGTNAIPLIEKAISMNPLVAENYSIAAQVYSAFGKTDNAVAYSEKAVKMARYNPNRYVELAQVYLRAGKSEKAVSAAHKAVDLARLKVEYYEAYAKVLTGAALNELSVGNTQAAEKYLKQTLTIPKEIDSVLSSVEPEKKKLWIHAQPLEVTDKIKLNLGIAQMWLGNLDQAAIYIDQVARNQQLQKESAIWQALLAQKQGNLEKAQEILQNAKKDNPNIDGQFKQLVSIKPLS